MIDIVKKSGDRIDSNKLAAALGCDVIETSALKGVGLKNAAQKAIELAAAKKASAVQYKFGAKTEAALTKISGLFEGNYNKSRARWYTVKLFERDEKVLETLSLTNKQREELEGVIAPIEKELDDDSETIITNERYEYISRLTANCMHKKHQSLSTSDKIDRFVTNRWLALPIFAAVMWLMYYISVSTLGKTATKWVNDTLFGNWITNGATAGLQSIGAADWLQSLIVNGIIAGVGTVLGFVPQMLLIFFILSVLEDSGYMARVAFIMDRIFRRFGLSGKSFIPMLIGTGCGVPAVMAARTIENEKDRRMTIMLSTFMPCTAKTVIIGMIVSTFFPHSTLIAPSMYFLAVAVIIFSGIALKKTKYFSGEPAPFVMELPAYHIPSLKGVLIHMWERSRAFIVKAGTIIFTVSVLVWFLSSFSWNIQMVDIEQSMLANIGNAFAWFFAPLGFGNWKGAVAVISALMAKEQGISTLAVLNGVADPDNDVLVAKGISAMFSTMGAFSFMILNLFDPPCIVAMATTLREMQSKKWGWFAIGYQVVIGYIMAFISFQIGSLFYGSSFGIGQAIAALAVAAIVYFIVRPAPKDSREYLEHRVRT